MEDNQRPIVLVGAGGHCRSVIAAALSSDRQLTGILDRPGGDSKVMGVPVIGTDADMAVLAADNDFVITLGNVGAPIHRQRLAQAIAEVGGRLAAPVVAASAVVCPGAQVGAGTVVLHQAVVNAGAVVGDNCIINTGSIIEHDAELADLVHVSTRAVVNGAAKIGARCMIGSGAVVLQGVEICPDCIIGAGAVVTRSITEPGTYVGVPARLIPHS